MPRFDPRPTQNNSQPDFRKPLTLLDIGPLAVWETKLLRLKSFERLSIVAVRRLPDPVSKCTIPPRSWTEAPIPGMEFEPKRAKPLEGRRVVVTRALAQSREITAMLESRGSEVIHFPTIEIADPADWSLLDAAIDRISTYDWIIFSSTNAVMRFQQRVAVKRGDPAKLLAGRHICALGPTTARAVLAAGLHVEVVAEESLSEGALRAITAHLGGEAKLRGLRFLIPRAQIAKNLLPRELRRLGAHVDAIEAYKTVKPDSSPEKVVELFASGSIDAITFTSPSTVINFASLAGLDNLSVLLRNVIVACIGPSTTDAAFKHGLEEVVQPKLYTAESLVESLVRAFCGEREDSKDGQ